MNRVLPLMGAAACLLAACSGPSAAPNSSAPAASGSAATLQGLVDAARKEGALNLVWAEDALGGSAGVARMADGFNKKYGLNLKIEFTPGGNFQEMGQKVAQEFQAKQPATSDVLYMSDSSLVPLMQVGAAVKEDWPAWAPNIRAEQLAPDGIAVQVQTYLAGITYNSAKLTGDAVPKSMQDLLKPQYKGRVASTVYASSFDRLATNELWGKQRTIDYTTQFTDQLTALIRCPEARTRMIAGEFDVFALDCNQTNALKAKAQGAPLDFLIPSDAAIIAPVYLAVPKNASHPNAAQLWINYALSREAQDIIYDGNFVDSHLVQGSKTAELIDKYKGQGVKFFTSSVEFFQRNDENEMRKTLGAILKILQKQK